MPLPSENPEARVAVIGGGISGLAAAHRLHELRPDLALTLLEAGPRLGGVLQTEHRDGFQIELGSDSFITNRVGAVELCQRIGFADQLVRTNDRFRQTLIVHRGKLQKIPEGFLLMSPTKLRAILTTPILSWPAKLRLAWEYFIPARRDEHEESIAAFVRRRLGTETYERLVQPLVGGIYTGDAEQLSLEATLPRFVEMERKFGGLIRAARYEKPPTGHAQETSGARYSLFVTPRHGLSSLVDAVAARLPAGSVETSVAVEELRPAPQGGWALTTRAAGDTHAQVRHFSGVILAIPTPGAARLLAPFDERLAEPLRNIPYAGAAIVSLAYEQSQFPRPLQAFGFVVPEIEQREILACSYSSVKFPGRAPEGKELLRVFVGGAKRPDLLHRSDSDLQALVNAELAALLGVRGQPLWSRISRYADRMPQYHLGHRARVREIEAQAAAHRGLELAGNAYHGVGIPDCICDGEQAAERLLQNTRASGV